jgi:hypothetical protein
VIGQTNLTFARPTTNTESAAATSLYTEGASLDLARPLDPDSLLAKGQPVLAVPEEALIADSRAGLTPSQLVERKLIALLKSSLVPVSHVQMLATGISRNR